MALVNGKEITFYYSDRFRFPSLSEHIFPDFTSGSEFYLYFQLDSQWYKMAAYQEVAYLGDSCMYIIEYIEKNGTFTTDTINKRIDGVEDYDIAQAELLSENLVRIMKRINKYNPYIEAQIQDGKLLLINKLKENHQ
ncbi:MAG: hypothetical protein HDR09_06140 [Lachnospiraceae bacterium]|nr:hypothetical protein [Lachnospiraceae bacterium]